MLRKCMEVHNNIDSIADPRSFKQVQILAQTLHGLISFFLFFLSSLDATKYAIDLKLEQNERKKN